MEYIKKELQLFLSTLNADEEAFRLIYLERELEPSHETEAVIPQDSDTEFRRYLLS